MTDLDPFAKKLLQHLRRRHLRLATAESVMRQGLVSVTAEMVSAEPVVVPMLKVVPWADIAVLGMVGFSCQK